MGEEFMVQVDGLKVEFPGRPPVRALRGVSFRVSRGTSCSIVGPSGCGKTTLLHVLAGLRAPVSGRAVVAGEPVRGPRERTALILQDYGLFPWKTVWKNVILGLEIRRRRGETERAEAILQELGIWNLRDRYPAQLSGGQRQRVAIARALAVRPDLLLMDEPFSSLDAMTREAMQNLLARIWAQEGLTCVIVTHDIAEAAFLGRQVVVMREGIVVAEVPNGAAMQPGYRTRPEFLLTCNRLRHVLYGENGDPQNGAPQGVSPGDRQGQSEVGRVA